MALLALDNQPGIKAGCYELIAPSLIGRLRSAKLPVDLNQPIEKLPIANPKISEVHAEVSCFGGQWMIRDLDSRNGTWIDNGTIKGGIWMHPLKWYLLEPMSRVLLGKGDDAVRLVWTINCQSTLPSDEYYYQGWPKFKKIDAPEIAEHPEATQAERVEPVDTWPELISWGLIWIEKRLGFWGVLAVVLVGLVVVAIVLVG